MNKPLSQRALDYHSQPRPGKISIELTTPANTANDLALAYSPGVAEPVKAIHESPENAYRYTAKGNLVAVISDGSAILGLGNLGALASKPVMEGKALLFKKFAGVDSIDIEVDAESPQAFIDTVARIANTFGGINLEDIKAPECFEIERQLISRCDIPVFHDDQHGTAIVTAAGMLNALEIAGKDIHEAKVVCLGAGAAATACMRLLINSGVRRHNIYMVDRRGVIHDGRGDLTPEKAIFAAIGTDKRTLADALEGADVFLGLAGPDMVSPEMLSSMAPQPVVFACANPDPEIKPEIAHATRSDLIMATGRSDYPNQVNNVLCFPYIFRGALDVRARYINEEMKMAAVRAIADLAQEPVPQTVKDAYGIDEISYGPDYIIPKPNDPRLLGVVADAVAKAAVESGAASKDYPGHYPLSSIDALEYI
ncbi:malate dehydrogenase [Motiliproteus coralliicola]|uniref:NADP-dependent malic enzyme n=1 Tax=Motiliproteus coralliicola TaxID=2283196 RepID=A0A369WQN7_9GAMM|nr:malic enzyme-like NAD(P)-binding protein [Motiliproteus coralliicola]RDE22876.1 malate dehydrogenase [Motiliproteus coralliicola]